MCHLFWLILSVGSTPDPVTVDKESTPPKTNMEPENGPVEKEIPIGNHHFHSFPGSMLIFGGVFIFTKGPTLTNLHVPLLQGGGFTQNINDIQSNIAK